MENLIGFLYLWNQLKNIGEDTKLYMNTDEFLYFDQNNRLVNYV